MSILPKRGVLVLEATTEALRECFQLRCVFDQEGARILASCAKQPALESLRDKHEKILEQAQSGLVTTALQIQAMEVDWALHRYLAQALQNRSQQTVFYCFDLLHFAGIDLRSRPYADRRRYERGGVLVVGPSGVFMRYIERVLPSLGETAVALRSLGEVVDGVEAVRHDAPAVADARS